RMHEMLGREPSDEELADELDMPVDKVHRLKDTAQTSTPRATPIGDDGTALQDSLEDDSAVGPEELAVEAVGREALEQVLNALPERERQVLILRFGLDSGTPRTLEEVGAVMGFSRERARQVERDALASLRSPEIRARLEDLVAAWCAASPSPPTTSARSPGTRPRWSCAPGRPTPAATRSTSAPSPSPRSTWRRGRRRSGSPGPSRVRACWPSSGAWPSVTGCPSGSRPSTWPWSRPAPPGPGCGPWSSTGRTATSSSPPPPPAEPAGQARAERSAGAPLAARKAAATWTAGSHEPQDMTRSPQNRSTQ